MPAASQDLLARINLWSFKLPGLADRREDIAPNIDYELDRFSQASGRHISFNREAREKFIAFALDPRTRWTGNFRDLNAMVVRMSTLADGGRITADLVEEEIARYTALAPHPLADESRGIDFAALLGKGYRSRFDAFDLAQLEYTIKVCQESDSMADAARKLFAVSIKAKRSANHTDRLSKYLARFGLKFKNL